MIYKNTILFFVILISTFSFYNVYASNSLSFDQTRIVLEHSGVISCIDCTGANGADNMTATLTGPSVPSGKTFTLFKVGTTNDYSSNFIKFTTSTSGSSDFFTTAAGQQINLTASGFTSSSANIFSTSSLSADYKKNKKMIDPGSSTCNVNNNGGDTDGDGICDAWENPSLFPPGTICSGKQGLCVITNSSSPSIVPYFIDCTPNSTHWRTACPSPTKADLYYEIDWMLGHKPGDDVISAINDTFANSNYVSANNVMGITFHAQLDEELPHVDTIPWAGSSSTPGFDQLKYWWFGNATERGYTIPNEPLNNIWNSSQRSQKAQVFHYVIFTHQQSGASNLASSGISEMPGNDAMISLGSFDGKVGTKDQQQGTLLHEIGHNLYLDHGGNSTMSCKPNYLSVMNPSFQFDKFGTNRLLDFSRSALPSLNENSLSESVGVGASLPLGLKTVYSPTPLWVNVTGQAFDWNRDGDVVDTGIVADLNNFSTITNCPSSPGQVLAGFQDWDSNQMKLSPLGFGANSFEEDQMRGEDITPNQDFLPNQDDQVSATVIITDELSSGLPLKDMGLSIKDQRESGIPDINLECKEGFEKLLKPTQEFGGCFTSHSANSMVLHRNWLVE